MKTLTLILLLVIGFTGYSQGTVTVNGNFADSIPAFTATKDTSWVIELDNPYSYTYFIKHSTLDATDSYMSIYRGSDPDGDGTMDWVLDNTLTADSLQLTPASDVNIITNVPNWVTNGALKLNYYHGTVSSGTINFNLMLNSKR